MTILLQERTPAGVQLAQLKAALVLEIGRRLQTTPSQHESACSEREHLWEGAVQGASNTNLNSAMEFLMQLQFPETCEREWADEAIQAVMLKLAEGMVKPASAQVCFPQPGCSSDSRSTSSKPAWNHLRPLAASAAL